SSLVYNDGSWHHAAGVLRSGHAELYVDGVLVAADSGSITSVRMSTQTVVGQIASAFVGDIDEVRIFSRALTPAEIAALEPPSPRSQARLHTMTGRGITPPAYSETASLNSTWMACSSPKQLRTPLHRCGRRRLPRLVTSRATSSEPSTRSASISAHSPLQRLP